eukprot:357809-Chlamydomonas_euryale.AAC.2
MCGASTENGSAARSAKLSGSLLMLRSVSGCASVMMGRPFSYACTNSSARSEKSSSGVATSATRLTSNAVRATLAFGPDAAVHTNCSDAPPADQARPVTWKVKDSLAAMLARSGSMRKMGCAGGTGARAGGAVRSLGAPPHQHRLQQWVHKGAPCMRVSVPRTNGWMDGMEQGGASGNAKP